ncbi:D-alanine--D-alanine ligase [Amnibacterium sp. CER49]|uniref:D-alanine--D-alanine ligase family protein n=1 Tax=Amnibacterium sp. CER49 TaxID=3039161 RepID=UPI00244B2F22|nr:D-alanine--D-alanine ligase [Amnibacterium sp. CER49]MDH2442795.1 D-alanine--D-alanine ligase [Amnibacterium sp. CER49]
MTPRTRVAVVFGGRSSEHSISCATAGGVLAAIDRERFEVIPIGITRDGAFVLERDDPSAFALDPNALPEVRDDGTRVLWPESATSRELRVFDADGSVRSLGDVDVAFPILHGPFGEDGTIQGLFELLGIPYVGNGVLASALGMDKHFTKSVLQAAGVPVAPWVTVTAADRAGDREWLRRRLASLGFPVFVKPARAGSSVGVTKVEGPDGLDAALDIAFAEDSRVLVERGMTGRELEIGVLGGRDGGPTRVSAVGEIVITGRDFYDFAAKYLDAPGVELVCPAPLGEGEQFELERLAARAFDSIGGEGLARVDVFLTDEGFVVNEINTMPGFTPISMFPRCWQQSGVAYPDLITELIALAR